MSNTNHNIDEVTRELLSTWESRWLMILILLCEEELQDERVD